MQAADSSSDVLTWQSNPTTSVPTVVLQPSISGYAQVGGAQHGNDPGAPTGYTITARSWSRCNAGGTGCSAISGATSASYTLQSADAGDTITYNVTATDGNGHSINGASAVSAVVLVNPAIVVNGTPTPGNLLTAVSPTLASGLTASSRAWLSCDSNGSNCLPISGQTSASYSVTLPDVGSALEFREIAVDSANDQVTYTSAPIVVTQTTTATTSSTTSSSPTTTTTTSTSSSTPTTTSSSTSASNSSSNVTTGGTTTIVLTSSSPATTVTSSTTSTATSTSTSTTSTVVKPPPVEPLTRAQKLVKALKACSKIKKKARRAACIKAAKKSYGPIKKKKG